MKIYLAARYSRMEELRGYADELAAAGHVITSRWICGGNGIPETVDVDMESQRFALEDYRGPVSRRHRDLLDRATPSGIDRPRGAPRGVWPGPGDGQASSARGPSGEPVSHHAQRPPIRRVGAGRLCRAV